jgi:hypothetical protein
MCDQVLAIGTVQARTFFALYLARGEMALNADSYFGAKLPGRFFPNFAYHFRVANNWPARPDPLEDLAKLHTVSLRAQEFDPVVIDLHIDVHPEKPAHPGPAIDRALQADYPAFLERHLGGSTSVGPWPSRS